MDNNDALISWLALQDIPLVGPATQFKLISKFGSPQKIFKATRDELTALGLKTAAVDSLVSYSRFDSAEEELSLLAREGIAILPFNDCRYPHRLRQTVGFPTLLFVRGNADCLKEGDWLGVVGSRQATSYGTPLCRKIVMELVAGGLNIASGFARGIDITAHLAAVEAGGVTAAVLAGGFSNIYPPENRRYIEKILDKGALITEFRYHVQSLPEFFPRRNRIISGLSRGVLVVEADEKSGAMITAGYALEQNRDLFALPGGALAPKSKGCHRLIQQGAKLVMEAKDILEEWKYPAVMATVEEASPPLAPDEETLHRLCCDPPLTADEIVEKSGFDFSRVGQLLTKLELEGKIASLPGGRYRSIA